MSAAAERRAIAAAAVVETVCSAGGERRRDQVDLAAEPDQPALIEFLELSKNYGAFCAVAPLSLSVPRGEMFGFLGPNGAGKTTTIRMMMGILVPSGGHVRIDGFDCHRDGIEVKRRVGYLPDSPIFYDYLRGREILQFIGEMHGLARRESLSRTDRLLAEFGLDEVSEEFAVNYSMGMKKKLGLACALIHEPSVLILDEPTNGLDPRASATSSNGCATAHRRA